MTTYICQWQGLSEIEYDEFSVEDDLHPPSRWKVWYHINHKGHKCKYWTILPKKPKTYIREVGDRDLTCHALDMTCEEISVERVEIESRLSSLKSLALQIENGRATLEKRKPRKFLHFFFPPKDIAVADIECMTA